MLLYCAVLDGVGTGFENSLILSFGLDIQVVVCTRSSDNIENWFWHLFSL